MGAACGDKLAQPAGCATRTNCGWYPPTRKRRLYRLRLQGAPPALRRSQSRQALWCPARQLTGLVRLAHLADFDLDSIRDYISQQSPSVANSMLDRIVETLEMLANQPGLGERRADLGEHLRMFVVRPYVVFYLAVADGIRWRSRGVTGYASVLGAWALQLVAGNLFPACNGGCNVVFGSTRSRRR